MESIHVRLSPGATTLAEVLRENGWKTAAILGAANLHHAFGLNQGFQFYDDQIGKGSDPKLKSVQPVNTWERKAEEVNELVFHWFDQRRNSQKFFLMIHYFDPHYRYDPPPSFQTTYKIRAGKRARMKALYDGEVSYVDQQIGKIIDKLESLGLGQNTLIIITADHGEALGDHHSKMHGRVLFDEQVHVPLIFVGPGIPPGHRISALVQHVDLAPTILDYLNVPIPSVFQGVSFLPTLKGKKTRQYVLLERPKWTKHSHEWAVRTETEKFIWSARGNHRLYDLKQDPKELHNLYKPHQEDKLPFFIDGRKYRSSFPVYNLAKPLEPTGDDFEPDEALKALGYVQ